MSIIGEPQDLGIGWRLWLKEVRATIVARRQVVFAFAAAGLVILVGQILHPGFASAGSIKAILTIASFVGVASIGQTMVFLVAGIDLSIPWVMGGSAILLIAVSAGQNTRLWFAIPLTLAGGLVVGCVNGAGVAFLGISPVVITLGMNGIIEGLGLGLTNGLTCNACGDQSPSVLRNVTTGHLSWMPTEVLIWIGVSALVVALLSKTTFGRRVYAIGNNVTAARLAGINVRMVTVAVYALSSCFAAVAGILLVGYDSKVSLGMGTPYLFLTIAAAVVGGTSIMGGRGSYLGTAAGAITLTALVSLLEAERLPTFAQDILYGVSILAIVFLYGREHRVT